MKLTNQKIYESAMALNNFHIEGKVPVKISFFLQKNIQMLVAAGQEIEEARLNIAKTYGELNEETGMYNIPADKLEEANKEIFDLFMLEQDINLHVFNLNDFDSVELTYEQMSIIMFMIEE